MIKIGIIREEKIPNDHRVPFSPAQCVELQTKFSLKVIVQPSPSRCFSDADYLALGIEMQEDLSECEYLMGVKEVPVDQLIPNKKYFFFSHTIKKQPYNKKLMQALIQKNIQMIDYECLKNEKQQRLLGFGRYAGIVGAYNSILAWGLRNKSFSLKPAHLCFDQSEMKKELQNIKLPALKFVLTGGGRVGKGAMELLAWAGIQAVSIDDYLNKSFSYPVFCLLDCQHYYHLPNTTEFDFNHFIQHSKEYQSIFPPFLNKSDVYISCHFWDNQSAPLFTIQDCLQPTFKTKIIADITCDINGSVPSTIRSSKISEPLYGFNPNSGKETDPFNDDAITVMAVDNLPCELPKDASVDFGQALMDLIIPQLFNGDNNGIIERASICKNGSLTVPYQYLEDYAK